MLTSVEHVLTSHLNPRDRIMNQFVTIKLKLTIHRTSSFRLVLSKPESSFFRSNADGPRNEHGADTQGAGAAPYLVTDSPDARR